MNMEKCMEEMKSLFEKLFTAKPKSSCCDIKIEEVVDEIEYKSQNSTETSKKAESIKMF